MIFTFFSFCRIKNPRHSQVYGERVHIGAVKNYTREDGKYTTTHPDPTGIASDNDHHDYVLQSITANNHGPPPRRHNIKQLNAAKHERKLRKSANLSRFRPRCLSPALLQISARTVA